jgi:hypothetical protein
MPDFLKESQTLSSILHGSGYALGQLMIEDIQKCGLAMDEQIAVVASSRHPPFYQSI